MASCWSLIKEQQQSRANDFSKMRGARVKVLRLFVVASEIVAQFPCVHANQL